MVITERLNDIDSKIILDLVWLDKLNQEIKEQYGKNAQIKATLFTGYKKPIRHFKCKLTEGASRFQRNGKICYDAFLGEIVGFLNE